MAQRIKVKPSRPDLIVLDDRNRRIPYKEDGHSINRTTLISRSIKCGDLIWVGEKEIKAEKRRKADIETKKANDKRDKAEAETKKAYEASQKKLQDEAKERAELEAKNKASNNKKKGG